MQTSPRPRSWRDVRAASMPSEARTRCAAPAAEIAVINTDAQLSTLLPAAMSARFRIGTDIANAVKDLGWKPQIGYNTFLYANEVEARQLLMWCVGQRISMKRDSLAGSSSACPRRPRQCRMRRSVRCCASLALHLTADRFVGAAAARDRRGAGQAMQASVDAAHVQAAGRVSLEGRLVGAAGRALRCRLPQRAALPCACRPACQPKRHPRRACAI